MTRSTDFAVIGGGIVGLTIAREIARRRLGTVTVFEKEPALGRHASGRNSGVLHAGIYYAPGSLRARVCVEGAREMFAWAREHAVRVVRTGKVIVATVPESTERIERLYERAVANGVRVELVDEAGLREREPEARTHGLALWSPETAVIDSGAALERIAGELRELGVDVRRGERVDRIEPSGRILRTGGEAWSYGRLVNAAGAWADRIARRFGVGERYAFVPFKGRYRRLAESPARSVRGSIYPAPDPRFPFLGVHVTRTIDDEVLVGPTATPAFGRENYGLLDGIDPAELPTLVTRLARLYTVNSQGFRSLVHEELRRYSRRGFAASARALMPRISSRDLLPSDHVGIRPQLIDKKLLTLVNDFVVEDAEASTHVLNAISPAFTASFSFAALMVDHIEGRSSLPSGSESIEA